MKNWIGKVADIDVSTTAASVVTLQDGKLAVTITNPHFGYYLDTHTLNLFRGAVDIQFIVSPEEVATFAQATGVPLRYL